MEELKEAKFQTAFIKHKLEALLELIEDAPILRGRVKEILELL